MIAKELRSSLPEVYELKYAFTYGEWWDEGWKAGPGVCSLVDTDDALGQGHVEEKEDCSNLGCTRRATTIPFPTNTP